MRLVDWKYNLNKIKNNLIIDSNHGATIKVSNFSKIISSIDELESLEILERSLFGFVK